MRRTFLIIHTFAALACSQTPVVTTIAGGTPFGGAPVRGFSGDGNLAAKATLALANVQNPCDPARFEQTSHLAFDAAGNLYIADSNNQRIRRIGTDGVISTVAGSGDKPATDSRCEATGGIGDGGDARSAKLYNPGGIAVLPNGSLIIADELNNRIRQVSPSGVISTLVGNGTHNLYAPGIPGTSSPMDWPSAVAVDANGLVYFAELHGNRVGRIGADGRLATVAGNGFPGTTSASLTRPAGLGFDIAGNLYIADSGNHRIQKVTPGGQVTTVAGNLQRGFSGDGAAANQAKLDTPMDVKVDAKSNIYIADTGNNRIRRVDSNGVITTVAGTGDPDRGRDLTDATQSAFNQPLALAVDKNNDVYVVDWQNYLIRRITFDGKPVLTPSGVVNSASFTEPVAPGSLVALFGANLGGALAVSSASPWPNSFSDVSVEVNGKAIPIFVVSPGQLGAQIPYGLTPGKVDVLAKVGGVTSNTVSVPIGAQTPGIYGLPGGRAAAQNQDFSLNTAANPELRGNAVVLYLTGLGEVSPGVIAGQAAPLDRVSRPTGDFTATIGGVTAEVLYIGLTPGAIGLAQANLRIPAGAPAGAAVPVVIRGGGAASNAATISIR